MSYSVRLMKSVLQSNPSTGMLVPRRFHGSHKSPIGGGIQWFPPGPKQLEQFKNWSPNLAVFSAVSFALMCYFTDWKVTNAYIPFYRGKFSEDD